DFGRWLGAAFAIAILASVVLSVGQRLHLHELTDLFQWMEHSRNPSYVQAIGWGVNLRGIDFPRMAWPFSEPSYASVWFAAATCGGMVLLLFSRRPWLGGVCTLAGGLALVNSLGMSG